MDKLRQDTKIENVFESPSLSDMKLAIFQYAPPLPPSPPYKIPLMTVSPLSGPQDFFLISPFLSS